MKPREAFSTLEPDKPPCFPNNFPDSFDRYVLVTWTEIEGVRAILRVDTGGSFPGLSRPLSVGAPYDKATQVCLLLDAIWRTYKGECQNGPGNSVNASQWLSLPYIVRDFYIRASHCEGLLPRDWPRDKDPHEQAVK